MNTKSWIESKLVWLGIIQTLIGFLGLLADFLSKGSFTPVEVTLLVSGCLTVILRIWFTDSKIE